MSDKEKFAEEEALGYNITIIGRNVAVTEAMKKYAWDKINKVERFHTHIMDVQIILDIQKIEHFCTIILKWNHFKVLVHAGSTDMYASIDKAIDRLQAKLRRWKKKIQMHHHKGVGAIDLRVNVLEKPFSEIDEINEEIEDEEKRQMEVALLPPKVIGQGTCPLKVLTVDEAVMKMELSGDAFLIFRDEISRKLKVIYRRDDGNYGVIETQED